MQDEYIKVKIPYLYRLYLADYAEKGGMSAQQLASRIIESYINNRKEAESNE